MCDQVRFDIEEHYPQFTYNSPRKISQNNRDRADSNVTPTDKPPNIGIVQLHTGPNDQTYSSGCENNKTDEIDHLDDCRRDHPLK